jgi:Tol biopolymer transport system component
MFRTALLCSVVAAALVPASAQATLVFDRHPLDPSVWVAADDGSGARRLASGSQPRISPDGATVAYMVTGDRRSFRPDLMVVPADGSAPPRLLAKGWRESVTFAWSPDSRTIAALVGPELGRRRLSLIDVATGARRTVADGFFSGVTFSPAGDELLYGRATSERYPLRSDIWRAPVAAGAAAPVAVSHDHRSQTPLWGPTGRVVFVRLVDAARRKYGPKNELYVMNPDGAGVARLTKTKVAQLLQGLTPTAWSADGTRLLAEFGGQDTSYAETVDPLTGAHKPVVKAVESGFVGTDLSADGTTILGATGGFDPGSRHDVVTIPYGGGKPTVLARGAFDPDWNR